MIVGVSKLDTVAEVKSPLDAENSGFVSPDKHSALVPLEIRGPSEDASGKVDAIIARVAEVQKAHPELYIKSFGESTNKALQASFKDDLKRAGTFSVPLTLIILLVAFGALVAAGIPLLLGLTSVLATLGLVAAISQVLPMSDTVSAIILLIGLAVGVDYTMFYLKREREERAAGRSEEAALEAAAATSGRSILISGLTVMVAMAGMFLTGDAEFASFGVATMTVVAVAMLGSLTVLPALLSKLGDKVDRGRVPFLHRLRRTTARDGSGEQSSIACCGGRSSRPCSPAGCWWPSQCPHTSCTRRSPASTRIHRSFSARTTGSRRRSPARRTPPSWSSRRPTSMRRRYARPSAS